MSIEIITLIQTCNNNWYKNLVQIENTFQFARMDSSTGYRGEVWKYRSMIESYWQQCGSYLSKKKEKGVLVLNRH